MTRDEWIAEALEIIKHIGGESSIWQEYVENLYVSYVTENPDDWDYSPADAVYEDRSYWRDDNGG